MRAVTMLVLLPHLCLAMPSGSAQAERTARPATSWPIVELRQYTLLPGKRDVLIDLFEAEFVESQEAVDMKIVGTFRDLDKPDRFVWLRAFRDMASRPEALNAFYYGPAWKAHRVAANATMVDASNVLLLHAARPESGFPVDDKRRAPKGATPDHKTLIVATIYHFDAPVDPAFAAFFERDVRPRLEEAGLPVLASFVTEQSANNFPTLPVRENEHVFVWFTKSAGPADYTGKVAKLGRSPEWKQVASALQQKLKAPPEVLRLAPTFRSQLHD